MTFAVGELHKNSTKGCTVNAFENAIEHSHVRVAWWLKEHFEFDVPRTLTIQPPNQFDMVLFLFVETFEKGNPQRSRLDIIPGPNDEIVPRWVQAAEPGITLHAL
ncbi:hypothetical protein PC129_g3299 [Phytophthora cactorum]|uniref:Uncharacterized protein n=1 Tax=Phytophthora cactorum TaxID=29920 RepID=A0A329SFP9_9STRA|nr:hypothetical protein Pcac1_g16893 [Phytophthora cactorum]KAG2840027.1 hypothetical protein PC112_g3884 [Phytophthora cactorum]KAG2840671.1 hypothetical protein PC111_g3392 [Phytophthora cactorum]KAG2866229.1 hypothetical protein PC113_g3014 [Phytophthora cactorum]KAG2929412.1 hypothetical protein PC114_g2821 [Phytophthora cactorum]